MSIDPVTHAHTPFYCEENIYHLITKLVHSSSSNTAVYAIFISNAHRQCLLFHQQASSPAAEYVIWDYHVVAASFDKRASPSKDESHSGTGTGTIWDLDSKLGVELPFAGECHFSFAIVSVMIRQNLVQNTFAILSSQDCTVRKGCVKLF